MKRVVFAATALAALSAGANAGDDRVPAKFVGDWCFAEHTAEPSGILSSRSLRKSRP